MQAYKHNNTHIYSYRQTQGQTHTYTRTHIDIHMHKHTRTNTDIRKHTQNHIYPTPPLGQDMTQGQFLSGV